MNELTQANFQEQMQSRIRASIGDLMPDAMLQEIISKGIEKAFNERPKKESYYGREEYGDPWIQTFLRTELEKRVHESAKAWLKDNDARVSEIVKKSIDQGIAEAVMRALTSLMAEPMERLREGLSDQLRKLSGN